MISRERERLRQRLELLEQHDAVAAARDRRAESRASTGPAWREHAVDVGLHRAEVDLEAQVRGGARHPLQVLVHRERAAAVDADDLEDAVAAKQPLVGDRDVGLRRVGDDTVDACDQGAHEKCPR